MSLITLGTVDVDVAEPAESALAAAKRMLQRNVGSLVVVDEERRPVGMITDRDLVLRVMAEGLDPLVVTVAEIMTRPVATLGPSATPETALLVMRRERCRRLPIIDAEGSVCGIISLDDLLLNISRQGTAISQLLSEETPRALARERAEEV